MKVALIALLTTLCFAEENTPKLGTYAGGFEGAYCVGYAGNERSAYCDRRNDLVRDIQGHSQGEEHEPGQDNRAKDNTVQIEYSG